MRLLVSSPAVGAAVGMCSAEQHIHNLAAGAQIPGYTCAAPGKDYSGTDLANVRQVSPAKCADQCNQLDGCTFFVYTKPDMCSLEKDFKQGLDGSNGPDDTVLAACIKREFYP